MKHKYLYLFIFFLFNNLGSNKLLANDTLGFVSPVDHQIRLTGNFMEIRPNHFHSGIDIKSSKGVPGDIVRAAQVGHVSRIRITSGSYGNALYIDHPNGYTTVYAHLQRFNPRIESYLKDIQYTVESFEVDVYLPDSLISIQKSEEIGRMGNSGRSFGPHLHFEIRETKTEMPRNPEELGIGPSDTKPPTLQSLLIYGLGDEKELLSTDVRYFKPKVKPLELHSSVLETSHNKVGLGLQMYDTMNGSSNKNGVYGYKIFVDDKLIYNWEAEVFSFSDNKKINGFIDYQKQKALGQKIYLLYQQNCNTINKSETDGDGTITLQEGESKNIKIVVDDLYHNHTDLEFTLKREGESKVNIPNTESCSKAFTKESGIFKVSFETESFFRPIELEIASDKKKVLGRNCHTLKIGDPNIPVNKYYRISCPIPVDYDENWTFITKSRGGDYQTFGADTLDNRMYCWTDQLGEFHVYSDKKAPTCQIINLQAAMERPWKVKISDNLSPDGRVDDLNYRAEVNGQWILMEYDLKNDVLIFDDFERLPPKPLNFTLEVCDNSNNCQVIKRTIS